MTPQRKNGGSMEKYAPPAMWLEWALYPRLNRIAGHYMSFADETQARIAHARYGGRLERRRGNFWEVVAVGEPRDEVEDDGGVRVEPRRSAMARE